MSRFASRLRQIRKERNLRQKDLAKALGLAQTTIANYEQGTRFPDEAVLLKITDFFNVSLDYLLGRSDQDRPLVDPLDHSEPNTANNQAEAPSELTRAYLSLLLAGSHRAAARLLEEKFREGMSLEDIYLLVIQPSLREVGRLWAACRIDVSQEHFFTSATQRIMGRLMDLSTPEQQGTHTFVGLSAGGELHTLGVRMVADFFEMQGWRAYYLGNNLPTLNLIRYLEEYQADVLGISASMHYHLNTVADLIRNVRSSESTLGVKIMVGGYAFNHDPAQWQQMKADAYARDAREAVREAKRLLGLLEEG